jgi:putative chitinase
MSIFKESFKDSIKAQLKKRQEIMTTRTTEGLQYLNSRNSWIRMSSAVDVYKSTAPQNPTIDQLKDAANYDNTLAKKYILQGGTLNENGTLKAGVGSGFENAYSRKSAEGNDYRLGIRPMPGITNIDVKSKGAYGSLREVVVNFQCWDIKQLEDLELLYMRPGYTVLVEWGWSPYFDENGNFKTTVDFYDIVNKRKDKEVIWKELDEKMVKNGNYEAMFGYVKNYNWNARMDGGYDCSTTIISLGEVIESLKVNYVPASALTSISKSGLLLPNIKAETAVSITDLSEISGSYQQNILAGLFYEMYNIGIKQDPGTQDAGKSYFLEDIKYKTKYNLFHKTININGEETPDGKKIGESDEQIYITLESLCDLLNNYVLLRDGGSTAEIKQPFARMSVRDNDNNSLLALAHPLQISVDPRVCLIKNMTWVKGININIVASSSGSATDPNNGDPVIVFNHNLGNTDAFINQLIRIVAPVSKISNKDTLAKFIKNVIQGPENNRHSQQQIEENIKELSRVYLLKLRNPNFIVGTPTATEIRDFGLTVVDNKTKQNISNAIDGLDPTTFEQFLNDFQGANFSDEQVKDVLTEAGVAIAKTDPVAEEQEKLADQKEKFKELAEDAKAGIAFLKNLEYPYYVDDSTKTELGIIGNIYINIKMLYDLAIDVSVESQDKKEKNEIALYDFIKNILAKISPSIGNVNNFDIAVDKNIAKIIDVNYVDKAAMEDPQAVYNNAFELQLHNLNSVVRSYKLESKIFPEQSTQVAIGAQVGGGALGIDTTTLVAFNRSIRDRIIPIKDAPSDDLTSSNTAQEKLDALLSNLETLYQFFGELKPGFITDADFDVDKAGNYQNALKDLIIYIKSILVSKTNNKAILPTVLSVDMDGIGGLIIGNLFKINTDVLPKGYKGSSQGGIGPNIGYIITGLGHTVGSGDWVTKIEAQTIILDAPKTEIMKNFDYSNITINVNPTTEKEVVQTEGTGGKPKPSKIPPTALIKAMKEYGITDPIEKAHFLAQCSHESGGFAWTKEFASGEAYEGRKDLGNTQPGDGKRFKGRGYIQITGRANYTKYNQYLKSKGVNIDVLANPQLLETAYAADSACYWWKFLSRDITKLAKAGTTPNDVVKVTRRVNGGTNGLADRQSRFDGYWTTLQKDPNSYT